MTLEGSGKWPEDPEAVGKTKASFLLQLAKGLQVEHGLWSLASEESLVKTPNMIINYIRICTNLIVKGFVSCLFQYSTDNVFRKIRKNEMGMCV